MDLFDEMTVTVPESFCGDTAIRRFTVQAANTFRTFSNSYGARGRGLNPGDVYTGLYRRGELWMSDTPDEKRDHADALYYAGQLRAARVLINGLGLGMVLGGLLAMDHVAHIDVVEIDAEVISLVAGHYQDAATAAGKTVTVHQGDACSIAWPPGTRWDIAWHDIWPDLCTTNLEQMATLHRRYGRRVRWQGSWGKELLLHHRRREQAQERRNAEFARFFRTAANA